MQDKIERILKIIYKRWKSKYSRDAMAHPDEEDMACFAEGRLSAEESRIIKEHLIACEICAEAFAVQARLKLTEDKLIPVPDKLIEDAKNMMGQKDKPAVLEIILRLREKALELLQTTGDVLVGQELVPAQLLRSRQIKDFKDEVTILKDFKDARVEIKIENKAAKTFTLIVVVREKQNLQVIKDLRVTLIKDELELESYLSDSGRVTFEHVLLGKYTIQISTLDNQTYQVLLDIRV